MSAAIQIHREAEVQKSSVHDDEIPFTARTIAMLVFQSGGPASMRSNSAAPRAGTIVGEGDFVIVHGRFSNFGLPVNWIAADIVRIKDGVLVEHWDVIQGEATQEQSRVVSQCSPHVRDLCECPIKNRYVAIVLEEAQPHESGHCSWRSISRYELTDHAGKRRKLSDLQGPDPMVSSA